MLPLMCNACSTPFELPDSYSDYQGMIRCPTCGRYHTTHISSGRVLTNDLIAIAYAVKASVNITGAPDSVNSDLNEAQLCTNVKASKACVVMCRRVVEQVCDDKGANGSALYDKINDLQSNGFLSENEAKLFNEIRYFGNYGAHPSDDLLGDVNEDDSKDVLEVTLHLVKHVYEVPEKIKKLEERRKRT